LLSKGAFYRDAAKVPESGNRMTKLGHVESAFLLNGPDLRIGKWPRTTRNPHLLTDVGDVELRNVGQGRHTQPFWITGQAADPVNNADALVEEIRCELRAETG
jgi:hypothetical protein